MAKYDNFMQKTKIWAESIFLTNLLSIIYQKGR